MAAPVIDRGEVIGVLIAQLSIAEIDRVVTGGRRSRQEGFGATGETFLVGPDFLIPSGARQFYENRDAYFRTLAASGPAKDGAQSLPRHCSPVPQPPLDTP